MSLDVYLTVDHSKKSTGSGVFVRENGRTVEISRQEWEEKFPGREPVTVLNDDDESNEVYWANITHNLSKMAEEAGIYKHLWRPEELGITQAKDLIKPLETGLNELRFDPGKYRRLNPSNGWGNYEGLVSFVQKYLEACKKYPMACVRASR